MNYQELQERCISRNFDQITVVVRDIFQEIAAMQHIMGVLPGDIRVLTDTPGFVMKKEGREIRFTQRQASYYYENTEICIVQPQDGDTVFKDYVERFGEGICCVRERISAEEYSVMLQKYKEKNIRIAQELESESCHAAWLDLTEELGILFEIKAEENADHIHPVVIPQRISQINITTQDLRKTIEKITELLEIGPWEVGCQSKKVVRNSLFRENGELKDVDFSFLLAILVCGNIEWEVIEPVEGPLVYNDFLNRRGIGFHHILLEIPQKKWDETLERFERNGAELTCRGALGPVDWCYVNTERDLHFYTEMRTDAVMDKLPDGYLKYYYPNEK